MRLCNGTIKTGCRRSRILAAPRGSDGTARAGACGVEIRIDTSRSNRFIIGGWGGASAEGRAADDGIARGDAATQAIIARHKYVNITRKIVQAKLLQTANIRDELRLHRSRASRSLPPAEARYSRALRRFRPTFFTAISSMNRDIVGFGLPRQPVRPPL